MAVEVLALPSLTQGEMELVGVRCQSSDLIQSGEMDRILKSLTFKFSASSHIPNPRMCSTSTILQQRPDQEDGSLDFARHHIFGSRINSRNSDLEVEGDERTNSNAYANLDNRNEFFGQAREFGNDGGNSCRSQAPITHPDGGHRCPKFPCPICHGDDR